MLDIKEYFPDVLKEVREFKMLDAAETPELKSIYDCIGEVLDNSFIETAKEKGVARAEKIVGLSPRATSIRRPNGWWARRAAAGPEPQACFFPNLVNFLFSYLLTIFKFLLYCRIKFLFLCVTGLPKHQ